MPTTKYEYDHPEGTGHATSPFFSIWYCHVPDPQQRRAVLQALQQGQGEGWRVVLSVEGLRETGAAPAWKRLSNKRRKKLKGRVQQGQQGQGH